MCVLYNLEMHILLVLSHKMIQVMYVQHHVNRAVPRVLPQQNHGSRAMVMGLLASLTAHREGHPESIVGELR